MVHTKFGVNRSKLCRDAASDKVRHHASNLVHCYTKKKTFYQHEIYNFLSTQSEDDLIRFR